MPAAFLTSMNGQMLSSHSADVRATWKKVQDFVNGEQVLVRGDTLDIATVVAVARSGCQPQLDYSSNLVGRMRDSVKMLDEYLANGYNVYGVTTGFGGSADSRTSNLTALQCSLLQLTQSGILIDLDHVSATMTNNSYAYHSMPAEWVRATMLIRCNTIARGHSAVRIELVDAILQLLRKGLTPVIPLRGSVSASGDLMPLSYIAGTLEGSPDVFVRPGGGAGCKVVPAPEALHMAGLNPIVLGPKEGLGMINGNAASAAVVALSIHDASQLAIFSQILTAMSCEALFGNIEAFHPFIAQVRPHPGQIEASSNIAHFLKGSRLVKGIASPKDPSRMGLFQDRYSLRSSAQWIGPQLEDLQLATSQLVTELNSTSDNPIVDVAGGDIYSGANFQAASMTSATEKTRSAMQMLGKMLFSLCSELINPDLNNGLPSNLAADNPSLSFTMKGVDINMAAYMSELAYIAGPISTHVQSAEMHNQAINSLALISARYTMQAVELVSMMCATHLYVTCQALDLRAMHLNFLQELHPVLISVGEDVFGNLLSVQDLNKLHKELLELTPGTWAQSTRLDPHERCQHLVDAALPTLMTSLTSSWTLSSTSGNSVPISEIGNWKTRILRAVTETFSSNQGRYFAQPQTPEYLGQASRRMYSFVRDELGVPFHRGLIEHPSPYGEQGIEGRPKKTIGSWIGLIYKAVRDGRVYKHIMQCLEDAPDE